MNLGSANVVIRPRNTRESLDLSLPFLREAGGRSYLLLMASITLAAFAACLVCKLWLQVSWAELWLVAIPLGIWLQGPFTLAAGELMFTDALDSRRILLTFARRAPFYTSTLILTGSAIALSALSIVLFPLAWSRLAFAQEACLLEDLPLSRLMSRSKRLGTGPGAGAFELLTWSCITLAFGVGAAETLGYWCISYTLQLPLPAGDLLLEGGSAYALLGWFASMPIVATLRFLRYIDRRTRTDGWDVQIRFQHIAQVAGEAA